MRTMCVCSRRKRNNHSSGRCAAAPTPRRALRLWVSGPVSGKTTSDSVSSTDLSYPQVSALPSHTKEKHKHNSSYPFR